MCDVVWLYAGLGNLQDNCFTVVELVPVSRSPPHAALRRVSIEGAYDGCLWYANVHLYAGEAPHRVRVSYAVVPAGGVEQSAFASVSAHCRSGACIS